MSARRTPAAALLLAALATPAAAQRVTKQPAPAADTAWYVVTLGTDTPATETVVRTRGRVDGELRLLRPQPMAVRYTMYLRADETLDSLAATQLVAGRAVRNVIVVRGDSIIFTAHVPGVAQPTVNRIAAQPGAIPFINLSGGSLEQAFRRARRISAERATIPFIIGPQLMPGTVRFIAGDSAVLQLGVELRARVDASGRLLGAIVPAQGVRFSRATAAVVDVPEPAADAASQADRTRYAAPAGAPYTAQDVTIRTPAGLTLVGTLTLPRPASSASPAPVVVTISGSGPQDRDSRLPGIDGYAIFRQLADTLGRRGVGVLRLDDRGVGGSDAGPSSPTSADLASDVRAAVAWLRDRADVDPRRIALLGHSEGAMIAPMVAARDSLLGAVVLVAAGARPGVEISAHQRRFVIDRTATIPTAAKDSVFRAMQARSDSLIRGGAAGEWSRFWWSYDPRADIRLVRAPVLVVHGETDAQVPVAHAEEIASLLRASGNGDVTVRRFPGVNHLLLEDADGAPEGYAGLASKQVPSVITGTIADWLASRLGPAGDAPHREGDAPRPYGDAPRP